MEKDNKKIDIKDYFQGENKKKGIAIGLMVVIVIVMIFFAMSGNDSNETTDEISNPEREATNYNNKLEAQGEKKHEIQSNDLGYYENQQVNDEEIERFDPSEIDNALAGTNISSNHNNRSSANYVEPRSNYDPYGSRDMYEIPKEKPRTRQTQPSRNYNYEETPVNNNTSSNHNTGQTSYPSSNKAKVWRNQNYANGNSNSRNSNTSVNSKIYKASIVSSRTKYLTPENNRVQIRVIEPFEINGVAIPRTTQLIAYASFQNELKLEIKSILMNGKQVPVSISVLDSQGQDAIEIVGGTGAEIQDDVQKEAINSTRTGNNIIDRAVNVFSGKKKVKAIVSSDFVYLRINTL